MSNTIRTGYENGGYRLYPRLWAPIMKMKPSYVGIARSYADALWGYNLNRSKWEVPLFKSDSDFFCFIHPNDDSWKEMRDEIHDPLLKVALDWVETYMATEFFIKHNCPQEDWESADSPCEFIEASFTVLDPEDKKD